MPTVTDDCPIGVLLPRASKARLLAAVSMLVSAAIVLMIGAPPASAAGTPNISLSKSVSGSVLYGGQSSVSLSASNPAGQPVGYNLSFRDVLPAGVSYVAGSAPTEPTIVSNAPSAGKTTLIWTNVSDLTPNSSYSLGFRVTHSTVTYHVGDSFTIGDATTGAGGAYINSDPRYVPDFDAGGLAISGASSYTGSDTGKLGTTQITAIDITKSEPSPEGELLRGLHDHQTVYTLTVQNNSVNPTNGITVTDYLPAGLEYLACGNVDWTTDAPTNSGSTQEYPGSGAINGHTSAPSGCISPSSVDTVSVDPDGAGSLPSGVYTKVTFSGLGNLAAGASMTLRYVAAIPIRKNTLTWTGATPTAAGGHQAANLDNNSGAETQDEDNYTNYATASGTYNGTLAVTDDAYESVSAEDLAIRKSVSSGSMNQGDLETWTMHLSTSEYRYVDDISVTDTLPDGYCPLGATNYEMLGYQTPECDPVSGQTPSSPYTSVLENTNGSYTIVWDKTTVPELARMQHNSTFTISFPTKTRSHYQENYIDTTPILSNDSASNSVTTTGNDYRICTGAPSDCSSGGTKINGDETDGTPDTDASSVGQSAPGPSIDKRVAQADPVDCDSATYIDSPNPKYGPGDRVCWRVRATFQGALDTGTASVTDFLPPEATYEAGSAHATANNTAAVASFSAATPGVLSWSLGSSGTVPTGGQVFEYVFSTIVGDPSKGADADIKDNLMKFSSANTGGTTFPLRDQSFWQWAEPQLKLTKGVRDVNNTPSGGNAANTDNVAVNGGDVVTYRVDLENTGSRNAIGTEVWDKLPSQLDCSNVVAISISDGGTCNAAQKRIEWSGLSVPANASIAGGTQKTLTYDVTVPDSVAPNETMTNTAGVRQYKSATNTGTDYTYVPASNIDPSQTPNTDAAGDTSAIKIKDVTLSKTRTTELTESGNSAAQATIGEEITYTITATIPAGSTLYGSAKVDDPLGTRQTYMPGTASATLNGNPLPTAGLSLTAASNTVTVNFPATYTNAAGSGDDTLVITFKAKVDDSYPANSRVASSISNTATWTFQNSAAQNQSRTSNVTTQIVEPLIGLSKANNDADAKVDPNQIYRYTLTVSNPTGTRVSMAHDLVVTDVVPAGLTPVDGTGTPIADGGTVQPDNGTWDATNRKITWNVASLAVNATSALRYDVKVDDPAISGGTLINNAKVTATSLPSPNDSDGERTSTSAGLPPGYQATATNTVRVNGATLTKTVSQNTATVGDDLDYTVTTTIPAGLVFYDFTVEDIVPDGVDFDSYTSANCISGCPPNITPATFTPQANANGSTTVGWFLGDLGAAPSNRVVQFKYRAHVDDRYEPEATSVLRGQTLVNSVRNYWNQSNVLGSPTTPPATGGFSDSSAAATSTVTVQEPTITIDKNVSGDIDGDDARTAQPGDSFTYTILVKNTGDSPAYDVRVEDTPDTELTNVNPASGASFITDGWTAGDRHMVWMIDGPIAPGATVTLTYTADLVGSANLANGAQVINTADATSYYGVPSAERLANLFDYRNYDDVTPDTDTVTMHYPQLAISKTTGAGGFPESADAEVNQSFSWRVRVTNNSTVATAKNVDVTDTLPANWSYIAGSAVVTPGSTQVEPSIAAHASGDVLTWSNVTDLAPGAAVTITFNAKPSLAAKTTPGSGTGNPNVNSASTTGDDNTGASGNQSSPYAAGPDTASAILRVPVLQVNKTPDAGSATAGTTKTFDIAVKNAGDGTARNVSIADIVPSGLTYSAGSATATSAPGFHEDSVSAGPGAGETTINWSLTSLAPGATATIHVPLGVPANTASGTHFVNNAKAHADEAPTDVSDTGDVNVVTSADLGVTKTADSASVTAGQNLSYTLHTVNNGPSDAHNVHVTDNLPAGASYVSGSSGCSETSGTVTCNVSGTMQPGDTHDFTVTVHLAASATGSLTNNASIDGDETDPVSSNDSDGDTTPIVTEADLEATKIANSASATAGENLSYTLTVTNHGPSDAHSAKITDNLPGYLSYVSGSSGCSEASGTVTCNVPGTLAPGDHHDFTVTVHVAASATGNAVNSATADSTDNDPVTSNDSDDDTTPIETKADLEVTKTGNAAGATAGDDFSYTLRATNHGPSDAHGVTITDALPSNVSFVSASSGCSETSGTVTCDVPGTMQPGDHHDFTLTVNVHHGATGSVVNSASIDGDETDPVSSNNDDDETTPLGVATDLAVTKTALSASATAGENLSWTLEAKNNGPSDAHGVTITDALPAGVDYVSSSSGCSEASGTVSCDVTGTMEPGDTASFTVTVKLHSDVTGNVVNTANVDGDEPDGNSANDSDDATTPVDTATNLEVHKTRDSATVLRGEQTGFEITVKNNGPSDAQDVTLDDTLPTGLSAVSVTPGSPTCTIAGNVSCDLGTIAAGDTKSVHVYVTGDDLGDQTNSAVAGSSTTETDNSDNADDDTVEVLPAADLSITKTGPANADSGDQITYTIEVANDGPDTATGVAVSDNLPAGTHFVSSSEPGCTATGSTVNCTLADIAAGNSASFTITVEEDFHNAEQAITNAAAVTGNEGDPDPLNNDDTAITNVGPAADLGIVKTGPASTVTGASIAYTLVVTNNGPSTAVDATVSDALPAGLSYELATPSQGTCNESAGSITCDLGDMASGASAQILVSAKVGDSLANQQITNTATVDSTTPDGNPTNDTSSTPTSVRPAIDPNSVDLVLTKVAGNTRPGVGDTLRYTINVHNSGPAASTNTRVTDTLASNVKFLAAKPSQGSCSEKRGVITCKLGTLASGADAKIALDVRPLSKGRLVNTASVASDQSERDASNNTGQAVADVQAQPTKLTIDKRATSGKVIAGGTAVYSIKVRNVGSHPAVNARVCDPLPKGLSVMRAKGSKLTRGAVCWTIDYLAPRKSRKFHLTARVDSDVDSSAIKNVANVEAANANGRKDSQTVKPKRLASGPGGGVTG